MKATLFALFVSLLMVGCNTSSSVFEKDSYDYAQWEQEREQARKEKREQAKHFSKDQQPVTAGYFERKRKEEIEREAIIQEKARVLEIARKKEQQAYHEKYIKPLDDALKAGEITEAQYALMHKQALMQQELEKRLVADEKARKELEVRLDREKRAREYQQVRFEQYRLENAKGQQPSSGGSGKAFEKAFIEGVNTQLFGRPGDPGYGDPLRGKPILVTPDGRIVTD